MLPVRLSILIPVYNGANSIAAVLERVVSVPAFFFQTEGIEADLIVVDDGSDDDSYEAVQEFSRAHGNVSLRLIRHNMHAGRGAAIRTALASANSDFCVIQDVGLEYDPGEYPKLLKPLLAGEADLVLGSRNVEAGYKAFRTSLAQTVPLHCRGFGFDPELVAQLARRHARVVEVPVCNRGGKQTGSLAALAAIFRARLLSSAHTDPATDMLVAMASAKRFNQWMADAVAPWMTGDVLELGAGIGNLTLLLSSGPHCYVATDTDAESLNELKSRAQHRSNLKLELSDFSRPEHVARFRGSTDTVVCLNVLEHLADDAAGLENIHACLRPGGTAIVLVPQGPQLFGSMDEVLHHKRRYTSDELQAKMSAAGFRLVKLTHFNHVTWPGWYLNSRLLRRRTLSRLQLRIFDLLVPLWRRIDDHLPWPATSLIAVGVAE
jgi:SAM-dependent methyltransferase